MDYEQQLGAIGAAANQEIAGLNEQVNQAAIVNQELNDEVLGLRETNRISVEVIESQRQQIVDLTQALADCTNSEPPTGRGYGVNIHMNWRKSQYAEDDKVLAAVQELGATRARTLLSMASWWDQPALLKQYADAGILVHLTVGTFAKSTDADKPQTIEKLLAVAPYIDSVAGFNEPDSGGLSRSQWLPKTAAWHNWLYATVKGHPDLKHLLVLPGPLQGKDDSPDDTAAYADALDGFDRWNAHWYPGNVPDVEQAYLARKANWPGPTWITEFGGNVSSISQETATRNILEVIRLHQGPGEAAFIYELLGADEFGMFDENWQPTPSGLAVIGQQPTEPIKTAVFGVSAPQNTTGGKALVTPGERIFFEPGKRYSSVGNSGQLYDALNRLAPGGTLWHSFKDRAGQWTRDLYTDIHTRWPDVRILATAFHEPKDNFDYLNATSWAQWVSLQQSFEDAVGDLDFVEMVTITEAWNNPTRAPGYWDAMLRERQAFGFDSYNRGIGAPKAYIDPEVLHQPILDYTNAKKPGQKLFVGETGSGITSDTLAGYEGRTQWLLDNRAYMAEHADVAMWWNSGSDGPIGQGCRLSPNELELWLGV